MTHDQNVYPIHQNKILDHISYHKDSLLNTPIKSVYNMNLNNSLL